MKAARLGALRINLDQLVWYTPTDAEAASGAQPSISIKTADSPSPLSVRYTTADRRDADVAALDRLFEVDAAGDA